MKSEEAIFDAADLAPFSGLACAARRASRRPRESKKRLASEAAKRAVLAGLLCASLLCVGGCHAQKPAVAPVRVSVDTDGFPEQARQDTEKAFNLIQSGKFAEAEPVLRRAIDADPMYGPAHNDMGVVYYETDRLYDAAWELEKAIKRMPDQAQPLNNLGLVLEKAGKMEDALQQFAQASQLDPNNAEYLGNLATLRVRLGMNDDQTQRILESLILHESRPQWLHWARLALIRVRGERSETQPATLPDN